MANNFKKQALNDLKLSGLSVKDFNKMGIEIVANKDDARKILDQDYVAEGYIIPYFKPENDKMIMTEFFRYKVLGELTNKNGKQIKYLQKAKTNPHLYFPPNLKTEVLKNKSKPLVITEGEKKAYAATKKGIDCISVGGVWSWKCKRLGKSLIDDFGYIDLNGKTIILCFDNDVRTNHDVMKALQALSKELTERGALVFVKYLPYDTDSKIGLDDYLLEHNKKDFDDLPLEVFESVKNLWEMNNKVAFIQNVNQFYVFDSNSFIKSTTFKNDTFANVKHEDDEGNKVPTAPLWLSWEHRREHKRIVYEPGKEKVLQDNSYNVWPGWGCEPEKGDVKPFLNAVNDIFGNNKKLIKWFLDWVAYPIQNPGTKLLCAVLLQSIDQGTGKSSIGEAIGAMYGENFKLIKDSELHSPFNEWAINKQFILGDEISGKDKRSESDKIKNLITQTTITINKKYSPTYTIKDCINYLFTSNHPDALNIEPDDRRVFVYEIEPGDGITLEQGQELENFRKGKGKSYLLHYFMHEYVISKSFNPRARPPVTDAKLSLIETSLTDLERWIMQLKNNPDSLRLDGAAIDRDLFTATEIASLYMRQHITKQHVSNTATGKALKKILNCKSRVVITQNGSQRLYPLRNFEFWKTAPARKWSRHYDDSKIALFNAIKKSKIKKQ